MGDELPGQQKVARRRYEVARLVPKIRQPQQGRMGHKEEGKDQGIDKDVIAPPRENSCGPVSSGGVEAVKSLGRRSFSLLREVAVHFLNESDRRPGPYGDRV